MTSFSAVRQIAGLAPASAALLLMLAGAPSAAAEDMPASPAGAETEAPLAAPPPTASAPNGRSAREAPGRRKVTKFEARRARHACLGRANERGLSGPDRDAFLTRCYFGRLSHRNERQQCRQAAAAKGIVDRSALRDFLRECLRGGARVKE